MCGRQTRPGSSEAAARGRERERERERESDRPGSGPRTGRRGPGAVASLRPSSLAAERRRHRPRHAPGRQRLRRSCRRSRGAAGSAHRGGGRRQRSAALASRWRAAISVDLVRLRSASAGRQSAGRRPYGSCGAWLHNRGRSSPTVSGAQRSRRSPSNELSACARLEQRVDVLALDVVSTARSSPLAGRRCRSSLRIVCGVTCDSSGDLRHGHDSLLARHRQIKPE